MQYSRSNFSLLSLFFLALSVLLMEVCLTRIFSVLFWHHFAYLIISLALLGFGAAGSYVTVSRRFEKENLGAGQLGHFAWLFSLTVLAVILIASRFHLDPMDITENSKTVLGLAALYLLVGIPFFFAGVCIGRLVALAGDRVNQFYFADLVGAGTGAVVALVVINTLGAVAGVFLVSFFGGLAALLLGTGGVRWRRWAYGSTVVGAAILTAIAAVTDLLPLHFPESKEIHRIEHLVEYSKWHVVGKIDVTKALPSYFQFGGALSDRHREMDIRRPVQIIFQDGAAPTGIMHMSASPREVPILGEYLQGVAYTVQPVRNSLIIGIGGGIDGLIALHYGTQAIVGVDLNPVTVQVLTQRYRDLCPALWRGGRVDILVAEGRHYLTRADELFDVIQLSGVDTYTALSTGAYALSENYLYTLEAMHNYWDHLSTDGILSFSRWRFEPPRETLRLVVTQQKMLEDIGVADPFRHFFVLASPISSVTPWTETLLKRSPFTKDQAGRLSEWAKERGFEVLYDPFHPVRNDYNLFLRAKDTERPRLMDSYPYNISPTTDDDPFFFQFYRWKSVATILGAGDKEETSAGGYLITRMPLGLIVLAISLIQIFILSTACIIIPLLMRSRLQSRGRGRFGMLVYFAALGLAFIFIEIALLQKFAVFVGGPVYSMAITLASILVFSGIGSYLARSFRKRPGHWLTGVIALLAVVMLVEILLLNSALPRLMGLSMPLRWLTTVLIICPVALLMGMPFPTGLRLVQKMDAAMRPWAWGINACATVLGSILCVLLSIQLGFTITILIAVVIYIIGTLGMLWAMRLNAAPSGKKSS